MTVEVVSDGMDSAHVLVVEEINYLSGHLLAFVRSEGGGFVGAAVAEEVGDKDAIAPGTRSGRFDDAGHKKTRESREGRE